MTVCLAKKPIMTVVILYYAKDNIRIPNFRSHLVLSFTRSTAAEITG
jgi:hypothetical protein